MIGAAAYRHRPVAGSGAWSYFGVDLQGFWRSVIDVLAPLRLSFALEPNTFTAAEVERWEEAQRAWLSEPSGLPPYLGAP